MREFKITTLGAIAMLFALSFAPPCPALAQTQTPEQQTPAQIQPPEATAPESTTKKSSAEPFPLTDPFYNNRYVRTWARRKGLAVMSVTFVDIDERLDQNRRVFTEKGYDKFISDLYDSGMVELIKEARVTVQVGMDGKLEIIEHGVSEGRYRWLAQIPIYMRFGNLKTHFTERMILTMEIVRSNEPHLRDAIGIESWATETTPAP